MDNVNPPVNPKLLIDQDALLHNLRVIGGLVRKHGRSMSLVTKGLVGYEPLVKLFAENGADSICEAHIQNLIRFKDLPVEKWLIRSPLISEADLTVCYADVSLVSERSVLKHLSAAAERQGRVHKVVIMIEIGELREGCMPEELIPLAEDCLALPGLRLHGIGAHLSSINEIVPDARNMAALADAATLVEKISGLPLAVISGGTSSSIKTLSEGRLHKAVNHLRIGEAVLLGNIVCYDVPYEGARTDAFTLNAEIIEVKEKPSVPWGKRAPGIPPAHEDPAFTDRGRRKRALIAVGKQDISSAYLIPLDPRMGIIGDTSDCFIADVTDCETAYKPGDTVSFRLKYNGLVSAMASDYIQKVLI